LGEVHSAEEYFEKLKNASCKMVCLEKLVKKYQALNKKLLIFSQFTEMLGLIEEYLIHEKINYEKIDGSTKAKD
jgi:SNF2 family DNA or RNA helicase